MKVEGGMSFGNGSVTVPSPKKIQEKKANNKKPQTHTASSPPPNSEGYLKNRVWGKVLEKRSHQSSPVPKWEHFSPKTLQPLTQAKLKSELTNTPCFLQIMWKKSLHYFLFPFSLPEKHGALSKCGSGSGRAKYLFFAYFFFYFSPIFHSTFPCLLQQSGRVAVLGQAEGPETPRSLLCLGGCLEKTCGKHDQGSFLSDFHRNSNV